MSVEALLPSVSFIVRARNEEAYLGKEFSVSKAVDDPTRCYFALVH